jgi:hypothetical protein
MTLKVVAAIAVTQYTALPKTPGHVWYVGTTWRTDDDPSGECKHCTTTAADTSAGSGTFSRSARPDPRSRV